MIDLGRASMAAAFTIAAAGCASVVDGSSQMIQVETTPVAGVNCTLTNKRGEWTVVTPAAVTVARSVSLLKATCSKPGWQNTTGYLAPTQSAAAVVGTVLVFGILETAVDAETGGGNKYPTTYLIRMRPIERSSEQGDATTSTSGDSQSSPQASADTQKEGAQ